MNRREFLGSMAAAPLIFGLREISAQDAAVAPTWYADALKLMKDKGRPGIILVVPELDPERREIGRALWALLDGDYPDAHEIFTGCVFICMTPAMAATAGLKKDGTKNRFQLDPDGKIVASDQVSIEDLIDLSKITPSFQAFLYGESRDRLKKWAEEKKAPVEVTAALKSLEAEDLAAREAAAAKLKEQAGEFHALLVLTRLESPSLDVRGRVRSVLEEHFKQADKEKFGARLPFGSQLPKVEDVICDYCGMARLEGRKFRLFLRFLDK